MTDNSDNSDKLINRLDSIKKYHPKNIDLSLSRILRLLNDLGSPHMRLPPVVHIAGTNGKGSVIASMRSILESAGYSVHVYTSPHLVSFNERIRLKGELIETSYLIEMLDYVEQVNKGLPITFFEFITALAYEVFSKDSADILLLETGLGGRLDATNVINNPVATVLTTIDHDHESYLGNEIAKIAYEKASIMKKNSFCVSCSQHNDSIEPINFVANDLGVNIYWEGIDWSINTISRKELKFSDGNNSWNVPMPNLPGDHQIVNLGIALATLSKLPFSFPGNSLLEGVLNVEWKGRLQKLKIGPLVEEAPDGWDFWLDGGHNNSAASAIANWLKKNSKDNLIIFGMMRNKDARKFLEIIAPYVSALATVKIKSQKNAFSSEELFFLGKEVGISNLIDLGDIDFSINSIMPFLSNKSGCILICGSLYLAGEVLENHA